MSSLFDEVTEEILVQTELDGVLPVPVELVARRLGITSIEFCDLDHDGQLDHRRGRAAIRVSASASFQRMRFTVAHELGHLVVGDHGEEFVAHRARPSTPDATERFCDEFAAALLMPRSAMEWEARDAPATIATLQRLADTFDTSLTATYLRARSVLGWREPLVHYRRKGVWVVHRSYPHDLTRLQVTGDSATRLAALAGARARDLPNRVSLPLLHGRTHVTQEGSFAVRGQNVLVLGTVRSVQSSSLSPGGMDGRE